MLYENQWPQFQERTEGVSVFEAVPFSNKKIILDKEDQTSAEGRFSNSRTASRSLDKEDPTEVEGRKLSQWEQLLYRGCQQDRYPSLLGSFKEKLHKIAEREDNWDGKGSKKPSPLVLSAAHVRLENFLYSVVNSGRIWKIPFVSSDEDGHITIQWNNGMHEFHIEIGEETTEYIKVWGANIEHEMHLGILKEKEFLNLWDWLNE